MSKELLACAIEAMTHARATIETLTGKPHRLSDSVIPRLREALAQQKAKPEGYAYEKAKRWSRGELTTLSAVKEEGK